MPITAFTPLNLTDAQASTIGRAALALFNKRLVNGRVNTTRGGKTPAGLAYCLADILKLDSDRNSQGDSEHDTGLEIAQLLRLRRTAPNNWFNTAIGTKTEKGLALVALRLFQDPTFVQSLQ